MSKQGGKREGAGRKPLPVDLKRETVCVRIPKYLIDKIPENGRGEFIENAIISFLRLKKNAKRIEVLK